MQDVSFGVPVPMDAVSGPYVGDLSVTASHAGPEAVQVTIEVLLIGDIDADGDVDLTDFVQFQL